MIAWQEDGVDSSSNVAGGKQPVEQSKEVSGGAGADEEKGDGSGNKVSGHHR